MAAKAAGPGSTYAVARKISKLSRDAHRVGFLFALVAFWVLPHPTVIADDSVPAESPLFERDVAPLLAARCGQCHGAEKAEAGLDLRQRSTMLAGGDSGPALVPGKPDESAILVRVDKGEMPPAGEPGLSAGERALLRHWIVAGAPLAVAEQPLAATAATRVSEKDRDFWAFRSPVRPEVPQVNAIDRVRTPIDAFVLARLEVKGLSFNDDAPRPVLLRRLCFDLHGLPPTIEQLDEFLADTRPDAYERLVDRLLDSPRYGERWGRHWLDVAGYADSDGYLAADRERPEAWRYRDYVIRALNADLPYDRFVQQQLAGDELSDWRRAEELTPQMVEELTATGFLRTASDPTYPGYAEKNECYQVVSDTIQIVSSAFLGLTVQCARCHAHKFDPISQRDYYGLQAILRGSYDPDRWQTSSERFIPLATEAQQSRAAVENQRVLERVKQLNESLAELTTRYRKKLLVRTLATAAGGAQADDAALVEQLLTALTTDEKKRSAEQAQLIARHAPGVSLAEEALSAQFVDFRVSVEKLRGAVAAEEQLRIPILQLRGLADLDDKPHETRLLVRGDYDKPGAVVEPSVPDVLSAPEFKLAPQAGYKSSGRRKAFAEWLVAPHNPLTARTQVNRIWQHHFGRALVPTVANFGHSGAEPSHPELLDWLATEFLAQGWSQKAIHRTILLSTTFRQSSQHDQRKETLDPDNVLLGRWRPRRVEGEVVRDATLAVAGKLNLEMFGPPVPVVPQPDGSVVTADDPPGNRRSVYLIVRRSQHLTMLDLFDTPMMEINCPARNESIVPLQALAMIHGPFAERCGTSLGERIIREAGDDFARQVDWAYRLLYARAPTTGEQAELAEFRAVCLAELSGPSVQSEPEKVAALWSQLGLVLLNTSEFLYVD